MAWGRVDDHHYRHPKVLELSDEHRKGALALFWLTISWCNDHLTDGRVPAGAVRLLGGTVDEVAELIRVGLWEDAAPGYVVHDYLDFNKSREQVEREREQRRIAGRAGADARWRSDSEVLSSSPSEVLSESPSEMGAPLPVTRYPSLVTQTTPPTPPRGGRRSNGTNPRAVDEFAEAERRREEDRRRAAIRDARQRYYQGKITEAEMDAEIASLGS